MGSPTQNIFLKIIIKHKKRDVNGIWRERKMKGKRDRRVVDPDHSGCFGFGFPERKRKLRERERERERELWRKRETEVGVMVRKKEGLDLREGGETVTAVVVVVTGEILRTLAMVALVYHRRPVSLPIAPLFLSLDPI